MIITSLACSLFIINLRFVFCDFTCFLTNGVMSTPAVSIGRNDRFIFLLRWNDMRYSQHIYRYYQTSFFYSSIYKKKHFKLMYLNCPDQTITCKIFHIRNGLALFVLVLWHAHAHSTTTPERNRFRP